MTLSKLGRAAIGVALTLALSSVALAPASAATAPVITWSSQITEGASYVYGQVPAAPTCTAVDEAAAAVDCTVSGYSTSVGAHTLTALASSEGLSASKTISYTVTALTLKGFYRPVKNTAWNKVKAGSTVPFKFKVFQGATKLKSTSVVASFTKQLISCTDKTSSGDPSSIVRSKKGYQLKYRSGMFRQNWKTPKAAKVTKTVTKTTRKGKKVIVKKVKTKVQACYVVTMTTVDGSSLDALFKLR